MTTVNPTSVRDAPMSPNQHKSANSAAASPARSASSQVRRALAPYTPPRPSRVPAASNGADRDVRPGPGPRVSGSGTHVARRGVSGSASGSGSGSGSGRPRIAHAPGASGSVSRRGSSHHGRGSGSSSGGTDGDKGTNAVPNGGYGGMGGMGYGMGMGMGMGMGLGMPGMYGMGMGMGMGMGSPLLYWVQSVHCSLLAFGQMLEMLGLSATALGVTVVGAAKVLRGVLRALANTRAMRWLQAKSRKSAVFRYAVVLLTMALTRQVVALLQHYLKLQANCTCTVGSGAGVLESGGVRRWLDAAGLGFLLPGGGGYGGGYGGYGGAYGGGYGGYGGGYGSGYGGGYGSHGSGAGYGSGSGTGAGSAYGGAPQYAAGSGGAVGGASAPAAPVGLPLPAIPSAGAAASAGPS